MKRSGALYDGIELSEVENTERHRLLDVSIQGRTVGRIRWDAESGVYRYDRITRSGAAPLHHGNDLDGLLRWIAHRP